MNNHVSQKNKITVKEEVLTYDSETDSDEIEIEVEEARGSSMSMSNNNARPHHVKKVHEFDESYKNSAYWKLPE
jgi:hypothetical protein